MKKQKISFDWDSTLNKYTHLQQICKMMIDNPDRYEVFIHTTRREIPLISASYTNNDIFDFIERFKIKRENVIFTDGMDKYTFLESFDKHYDDDIVEIELLRENTNCIGILVPDDL